MLAIKLYKVHDRLGPELMNDIFKKRNMAYNFRKNSAFETRNIKSVYYGSEAMSFLGPKILELLSSNIKVQKILTSSNQILNFGIPKTVHAVCAGNVLQT